MAAQLIDALETATIVVSGFLIKKYVFLEPDMEGGRQHVRRRAAPILTRSSRRRF